VCRKGNKISSRTTQRTYRILRQTTPAHLGISGLNEFHWLPAANEGSRTRLQNPYFVSTNFANVSLSNLCHLLTSNIPIMSTPNTLASEHYVCANSHFSSSHTRLHSSFLRVDKPGIFRGLGCLQKRSRNSCIST